MNDRVFVDTNLLVYLFDRDAPPEKRARVRQEFYVAPTAKLATPLSPEEAEEAVTGFASLPVVQVDPPMVIAAIRAGRRHRLSFWDALIVQAAVEAGCARPLSEDMNHGRQLGPVRIENPFRPS